MVLVADHGKKTDPFPLQERSKKSRYVYNEVLQKYIIVPAEAKKNLQTAKTK